MSGVTKMSDRTCPSENNWRAELDLVFKKFGQKTALSGKSHVGPLMVQKPFYPEGPDVCHTYIVHPPGGVAGGDRLSIRMNVGSGAHALLTTPAAGKYYRSPKALSTQTIGINVDINSVCEWFPQESIFYNGAGTNMKTVVNLNLGSRYIGWDVACLGLEASGNPFEKGEIRQNIEIYKNSVPIFIEAANIRGDSGSLTAPWGLNGKKVFGYMVCVPCPAELVKKIKSLEERKDHGRIFSVTLVGKEVLVCRFLGKHAFNAFKVFLRTWEIIRSDLMGKPSCPPRIWKT